mgnify:CR=1 FL=1
MNIQLIQGEFNPNDAIELIAQLVKTKIMYHENKINYDFVSLNMRNKNSSKFP